MKKKKFLKSLLPFIFYIAIWEFAAVLADTRSLFPSFTDVVRRTGQLLCEKELYIFSFNTLKGVLKGFFLSLAAGSAGAYISFKNKTIKDYFEIPLTLMKSVPVTAYIIILYMFLESRVIPAVISFIAVFPVFYNNIFDSFSSCDRKLFEMAKIYKMKKSKIFSFIFFPQAFPFFKTAVRTGLPLSFKASVAAEVITIAAGTVGESFYNAKIYFEMTDLLSWTFCLLVLTLSAERLSLIILDHLFKMAEGK